MDSNSNSGFSFVPANKRKAVSQASPLGRVPRITRMLALAIHLQELVDSGHVANYSEIAALGYVSRARVTQLMDLTMLAPDIQEEVLFLPEITKGRDPWSERTLRGIAMKTDWTTQRKMWGAWRERAKINETISTYRHCS